MEIFEQVARLVTCSCARASGSAPQLKQRRVVRGVHRRQRGITEARRRHDPGSDGDTWHEGVAPPLTTGAMPSDACRPKRSATGMERRIAASSASRALRPAGRRRQLRQSALGRCAVRFEQLQIVDEMAAARRLTMRPPGEECHKRSAPSTAASPIAARCRCLSWLARQLVSLVVLLVQERDCQCVRLCHAVAFGDSHSSRALSARLPAASGLRLLACGRRLHSANACFFRACSCLSSDARAAACSNCGTQRARAIIDARASTDGASARRAHLSLVRLRLVRIDVREVSRASEPGGPLVLVIDVLTPQHRLRWLLRLCRVSVCRIENEGTRRCVPCAASSSSPTRGPRATIRSTPAGSTVWAPLRPPFHLAQSRPRVELDSHVEIHVHRAATIDRLDAAHLRVGGVASLAARRPAARTQLRQLCRPAPRCSGGPRCGPPRAPPLEQLIGRRLSRGGSRSGPNAAARNASRPPQQPPRARAARAS